MRRSLHRHRDAGGAAGAAQVKGSGVLRGGSSFKPLFFFIHSPAVLLWQDGISCLQGFFCKAGITDELN